MSYKQMYIVKSQKFCSSSDTACSSSDTAVSLPQLIQQNSTIGQGFYFSACRKQEMVASSIVFAG